MKNHSILNALSGENTVSNIELKAWLNRDSVINPFIVELNYKVFGFIGSVYKTENVITLYVDLELKNYKIFIVKFQEYETYFNSNNTNSTSNNLKKFINLDTYPLKSITKEDVLVLSQDFKLSDKSRQQLSELIDYLNSKVI